MNKAPTNKPGYFTSRMKQFSINAKIVAVIIILTGSTWPILDYYQGKHLNALFEQQLNSVLQHHAQEARILFDKYIRSFHSACKIIISQQSFTGYLEANAAVWADSKAAKIKYHAQQPPWLPKASVMRTLAQAQYYLLFGPSGQLREVFSVSSSPLPPELLDSAVLVRQLSHNQSLMTELDSMPFMIASNSNYDADQNLLGSLTIASPLNNKFLSAAIEGLLPNKTVALVDNKTEQIIASSRPDLIKEGSTLTAISDMFLLTGKSFFDYGASSLRTHFISLIAKNEYDALTAQIHAIGQRQRAIICLVMTLPLLAALFWIAHRLTKLTSAMTSFSKEHLSGKQNVTSTRDQLQLLEERFTHLTNEIIRTNIESENKYRALIETTATGFVIVDAAGHVLDANQEYLRMTGRENFAEIMNHNVLEWTAPHDIERNLISVKKCFRQGFVSNLEIDYIDEAGNITPVEINARVVEQEGEKIILTIMRDIRERKNAAETLQKSLAEKEALLKEIHHRVKNNMQIISSLLSLQAERVKNPEAAAIIQDSRDRVKSMGLIHEKLYHRGDLAQIDFGDYINTLSNEIARSYRNPAQKLQFKIDADDFSLPIDIAIPCGLLISELITNSIKHAFPDNRDGEINIIFEHRDNDTILMGVKDNGIGYPKNFDSALTDTLGFNVVKNLARQLEASVDLINDNGAVCMVNFSMPQG